MILIAGCGDLGLELAKRLQAQGLAVTGLRRSDAALPQGVDGIRADVTEPHTLEVLAELRPNILYYCVAASEHTDAGYEASYVAGLRNVLAALAPVASLQHVFFVSSTGVYGQSGDQLMDESIVPQPAGFSGERMLQAENLLKGLTCASTILRLSGTYGPGRNRMITLAQQPQRWPQQGSWTNRIHRDDAAAFSAYLIKRVLQGQQIDSCYLVTDSAPVSQFEVLSWLAAQLGVDASAASRPDITAGKRLSNQRLRDSGFVLQYDNYTTGYASLLALQQH